MPKINIYLPDELAQAVKDAGVPASAVCQRALKQAVRRIAAIRTVALTDLATADLAELLPNFTGGARSALARAIARTGADEGVPVGTAALLSGVLAEKGNLALRVLDVLEIEPSRVRRNLEARTGDPRAADAGGEAATGPGEGPGLRFGDAASAALKLAANEAIALGHNYIGCEHLLLGLVAEPDGAAGQVLRDLGAEPKTVRRTVESALMGYTHLRAQTQAAGEAAAGGPAQAAQAMQAVTALIRQELQPLAERLERLEGRTGAA
ncbi:Clp protease N-terminal domain-containing protein [Spirillospora sp. NBC_01491]|uniref:Clp protease N-terminal domain-containing protein n=1 Tax=Spirillospora sp. NBC_01491 TaxID=2976007 RepID=UPI002E375015|nr:Clp protease N-terminal domain-containing protein [Spirillospora sp. NBC_01491]